MSKHKPQDGEQAAAPTKERQYVVQGQKRVPAVVVTETFPTMEEAQAFVTQCVSQGMKRVTLSDRPRKA